MTINQTRTGRFISFLKQNILPIAKVAFLALVLIDVGYLVFCYRVNTYLIPLFTSKFVTIHQYGRSDVCENDSWWFHSSFVNAEPWQHILEEETLFPIAYTILAFDRPDQVWRLLRSIYRPHNFYCIHYDKKSPILYKTWLERKINSCIPSNVSGNIFFISPLPVHHSYMSVLDADLACMRTLWKLPKDQVTKKPPWKYLINLTGQEFPLKNNLELTRILAVLNNTNLIEQQPFFFIRRSLTSPPHGIQLHKGAVHVVVTWKFINFIFTDERVQDFIKYLPNVGTPDEALFSTVNHNAVLNAPGNFPYGDENYKKGGYFVNRFKTFWPGECTGIWRHAVCIFSLRGMQPLFDQDSPYLFVNKFVMNINADVLDVTEQWFYKRQDWYYRHAFDNITNLDFFRNLPQVIYQSVRKTANL